jgi:hypothetical protein
MRVQRKWKPILRLNAAAVRNLPRFRAGCCQLGLTRAGARHLKTSPGPEPQTIASHERNAVNALP